MHRNLGSNFSSQGFSLFIKNLFDFQHFGAKEKLKC